MVASKFQLQLWGLLQETAMGGQRSLRTSTGGSKVTPFHCHLHSSSSVFVFLYPQAHLLRKGGLCQWRLVLADPQVCAFLWARTGDTDLRQGEMLVQRGVLLEEGTW